MESGQDPYLQDVELVRPGILTIRDVELCTKAKTIAEALKGSHGEVVPKEQKWMLSGTTGFQALIGIAVSLNAIQLGVEVDYPEHKDIYSMLDHLFTFLFFAEFLLKLHDLRLDYFRDSWNVLDCVLVWLAVLDCWIFGLLLNDGSVNFRSFSVLRILRVARVIRAIRLLKVFRKLWKIVRGIINSVRTVFWACGLLVLLLYVCSIFCCTMIAGKAEEVGYFYDKEVLKEMDMDYNVYEFYGTVPRSMFTLFETVLEPLNFRPIIEKQPFMMIFFLAFIFLTTFGVLNVIIGIIVDSTMASDPEDDHHANVEMLYRDVERIKTFRTLCLGANRDHDPTINLPELYGAMANPGMKRILEDINMPLGLQPEELFSLLSPDGDKGIIESDMMRQMTRAVCHTERQQLLDLKIEVNKMKNYAHANFEHLDSTVSGLAGTLGTLQEQQQELILENEEMKDFFHNSFNQLLRLRPATMTENGGQWKQDGYDIFKQGL